MRTESSRKAVEPMVEAAADRARPLGMGKELDGLVDRLAKARVVMLGEASHGTHEFYEWRRVISERLLERHGFDFIAVEGDWPPCRKVGHFVRKAPAGDPVGSGFAAEAARLLIRAFHRWPTWMWANEEIVSLMGALRRINETRPLERKAGFFGLDVYSLFESIDEVLLRLEAVNPFLARRARLRYRCFDRFEGDEHRYARSLFEEPEGCEEEVVRALQELLEARLEDEGNGPDEEALFDVRQNARIIRNAELYYRTMIHGMEDSWNVRDRHMMETLELLLERHGPGSKAIVWEHNTHIGDYRATDMAAMGQVNIGGLARERLGAENVALVGFGTYEGKVTASHAWGGPIEKMEVPPGAPGSCEDAFRRVAERIGHPGFHLTLDDEEARGGPLAEVRDHRAIGVAYDPRHERRGNYVPTSLAYRYDAFVFIDRTRALEPLPAGIDRGELPETWPAGY